MPSPALNHVSRSNSKAEEQVASVTAKVQNCGTTATVVLIVGTTMVCAHVGDCRAVLSRRGGEAVRLCEDHRPSRKDELARIEAAGGLILSVAGAFRVNGILAVSRAIGDRDLKEYVIAEPEVISLQLSDVDEYLVVASDGMWDFVTDKECVDLTHKLLVDDEMTLEHAAKALVMTACDRGSRDDVSVLIIDLGKYMTIVCEGPDSDHDDEVENRPSQPGDIVEDATAIELSIADIDLNDSFPIPQTSRASAVRSVW
jgi:serine/threonine protein phosphatase PrpC